MSTSIQKYLLLGLLAKIKCRPVSDILRGIDSYRREPILGQIIFLFGEFFGISLSVFNQVQFFVCFSSVAQLGDGVSLSFLLVVLCLCVQDLDQFSSRSSFFELAISLAFILTTLTIVQDKSRNYIVTLTIGGKIAENFLWNIVNSRGTAIGITPPSWNGLLDPEQRSPQ